MAAEEDACRVCDGDKSTTRNPIIFCDGKGCNMPVHKICYGVDEVPEDDWYCQRCENKKRKKATNIICCSTQTGAIKKTTVAGEYMHVICAMWNSTINQDKEPYNVSKSLLDKDSCHYCLQKKGLCMACEEPNCTLRFHAICGINNSLITPAASVPSDFVAKCSKHQTIHYPKNVSNRKRHLRRNDSDDEEDETDESDEESDDAVEEDEEDEEEEDDFRGARRKMSAKSKTFGKSSSIIPMKRRASPNSLFPEDQHSSEDDDDMGTSSTNKSKLTTFGNPTTTPKSVNSVTNSTSSSNAAAGVPSYKDGTLSYKDRLEAKRKKSTHEMKSNPSFKEEVKKPLSITPPPPSSIVQKQKLPNKTHLNNNNSNPMGPRPSTSTPPAPIKRLNNGNAIMSIDEIQNDIKNQRWNNGSTILQHPQPTTPGGIATTSFFENELAKNAGQRKSMDGWKLTGGEKEELVKLREENKRLVDFKKSVSEVLIALKSPVAPGLVPDVDHVEHYVSQLQALLRRVGPIYDHENVHIQESIKTLANTNNNSNTNS